MPKAMAIYASNISTNEAPSIKLKACEYDFRTMIDITERLIAPKGKAPIKQAVNPTIKCERNNIHVWFDN